MLGMERPSLPSKLIWPLIVGLSLAVRLGLAADTGYLQATQVTAGLAHTCAVGPDPTSAVYCWGEGSAGQLGNRTESRDTFSWPWPSMVARLPAPAAAVVAGGRHTCALLSGPEGSVYCWGENEDGQLGNGTTNATDGPVAVEGLPGPATALAAGHAFTCALLANPAGQVYCWGDNSFGQLGTGCRNSSAVPVPVQNLTELAMNVTAKGAHVCVLLASGTVSCWGSNLGGALGNGTDPSTGGPYSSDIPLRVALLPAPVAAVQAGVSYTCVLLSGNRSDQVYCWGSNGKEMGGVPKPKQMPSRISALALGYQHACVLDKDNQEVFCWGMNNEGQLGSGTMDYSADPVPVSFPPWDVGGLAAGQGHTCALADHGKLLCWGSDDSGQLGDGSIGGMRLPTVVVEERDEPGTTTTTSTKAPPSTTTTTRGSGGAKKGPNVVTYVLIFLGCIVGVCALGGLGFAVYMLTQRRRTEAGVELRQGV